METLLLAGLLLVHDAPSGWKYPAECCSNAHCHPVPCDELLELKDGGWRWDRYTFSKHQARPSGDRQCHVCTSTPAEDLQNHDTRTYCVFTQQGS